MSTSRRARSTRPVGGPHVSPVSASRASGLTSESSWVEPGGIREDVGDLPRGDERVTRDRQAEVGGEPLETGRAVSRQRLLRGRTEAGRRTDDLADRARDEDARVVAVGEGALPQGSESCCRVGTEQVADLLRSDRVGQRAQHLDDLHREQVELVQRALDGGPTGGARRECSDIGGDRVEQVGPGTQERGERAVVAGPQVVSKAARPVGGHPSHGSRLPRALPLLEGGTSG